MDRMRALLVEIMDNKNIGNSNGHLKRSLRELLREILDEDDKGNRNGNKVDTEEQKEGDIEDTREMKDDPVLKVGDDDNKEEEQRMKMKPIIMRKSD